jgi:hypothetical protein
MARLHYLIYCNKSCTCEDYFCNIDDVGYDILTLFGFSENVLFFLHCCPRVVARSPAVAARSSLQSLTLPTLASEVPPTILFPFYVYYIYAARYSLYRDEIHDDLVACVGMDIAGKKTHVT